VKNQSKKTPQKKTRNTKKKVVQYKIKKITLKKEPKGYKVSFWDCNDLREITVENKEFYSNQDMNIFQNIPDFKDKESVISKIKANEYNKNFSDDPKADSDINKEVKRIDESLWVKLGIVNVEEKVVEKTF
jgi:hypothetical protein